MSEVRQTIVAPTRTQSLRSGGSIDMHRHDEHQIVYAGRSVLTVTTDAGSWICPGTRAVWVPAGTPHAHSAHGDLDLHLVGLPIADNPLRLDRPTLLAVDPLLRELIVAYTADPGAATSERERLRAVMLDRLRVSAGQPVHFPTPTDPVLRRVCELLSADPADDRSLGQLARVVGSSERTLSRLFARDLGLSFTRWRTQVRLGRALVLLADGESVTAVAHRCGWSSTSAFIDVFRKALGQTPGRYQASTRE